MILTGITFWGVTWCDFICLDDVYYVKGNPHLHHGFSWKSLEWAFSAGLLFRTPYVDYWQPITVLSHIVDVTWFGLNPAMHHLTNLSFHIVNGILVYVIFLRITNLKRPALFIAALFAVHPLHVESVAWVTERKDVLSCFFWLLSLQAYLRYAARSSLGRYVTVLILFIMGLMAKPMNVTFPAILLVLDVLILKRAKPFSHLLFEKLLFFAISMGSILLTLKTQSNHLQGSVSTLLGVAVSSYTNYISKTLVPVDLSIWYYYQAVTPYQIASGALVLGAISLIAIQQLARRPYFLAGWLWFLITLTPVITLNDIAGADRFTYVSLLGLFWIVACVFEDLVQKNSSRSKFLLWMEFAMICIYSIGTFFQVRHWKNSITLFEHAHKLNDNYVIRYFLAMAYFEKKEFSIAESHFKETIRLEPGYVKAYANLGLLCGTTQRTEEAKGFLSQALTLDPVSVEAHYNLGTLLLGQNQLQDAEKHLKESIILQPDFVDGYYNLGNLLLKQNRLQEAAEQFATALEINPEFSKAHNNLGICLVRQQQFDEGMDHYQAAIQLAPQWAEPYVNMGLAYLRQNNPIKARPCLEKAIQLDPNLKKPRELLDQIDATHK